MPLAVLPPGARHRHRREQQRGKAGKVQILARPVQRLGGGRARGFQCAQLLLRAQLPGQIRLKLRHRLRRPGEHRARPNPAAGLQNTGGGQVIKMHHHPWQQTIKLPAAVGFIGEYAGKPQAAVAKINLGTGFNA